MRDKMNNLDLKSDNSNTTNKRLYEFLATSYDIGTLAGKIDATRKASMSIFNLKKMVNEWDSVIA